MDKEISGHPPATNAIGRIFSKILKRNRYSICGAGDFTTAARNNSDEEASRPHPWMALFDDPALHEALDRVMAVNGIS